MSDVQYEIRGREVWAIRDVQWHEGRHPYRTHIDVACVASCTSAEAALAVLRSCRLPDLRGEWSFLRADGGPGRGKP